MNYCNEVSLRLFQILRVRRNLREFFIARADTCENLAQDLARAERVTLSAIVSLLRVK